MPQLRATLIRKQIREICEFCITLVNEKNLTYDVGLDQTSVMKELNSVLKDLDEGSAFCIAFVGEYSSTIINLLTDTHRETGTDVSTDRANKLRWNDYWVIDTPGLGSGRPDHDKETEVWLAGADLLVYVLTPDLFGSGSGKRLLEMIDRYRRDHEMMVVVNMIDKEGNDISIYREELQAALLHRPVDEFFPTFISAKDKEKSLDFTNPSERRDRLAMRSGFDMLLSNLDSFVLRSRERAALTTPLTRLQVLMRKMRVSTEYTKEDALLNLRMAAFEKALREIMHAYAEFKDEMGDAATGTAGVIFNALSNPPEDFNIFCTAQLASHETRCNESVLRLATYINSALEVLKDENLDIDNSQLAREVSARIEASEVLKAVFESFSAPTTGTTKGTMAGLLGDLQGLAKISGKTLSQEWSAVLGSRNAADVASKLAGMVNREVVLNLGHKLGYKFKPWEAVNLSARLAKAVPLLNLAAAAWEMKSYQREKKMAEEAAKELRQFKVDVKSRLADSTEKITKVVYDELIQRVEKVLIAGIEFIHAKKSQLAACAKDSTEGCNELEARQTQCLLLYDEIYETTQA